MAKRNTKRAVKRVPEESRLERIMNKVEDNKPHFDKCYNPLAVMAAGNAGLIYGATEAVENTGLQGVPAYMVYAGTLGLGYLLNKYVLLPLAKREYQKSSEKVSQKKRSGWMDWIKNVGLTAATLISLGGIKDNYSVHSLEDAVKDTKTVHTRRIKPSSKSDQSDDKNLSRYERARELYVDLKKSLDNENLVRAMVANAWGESKVNPYASGDCGKYGRENGGIEINGEQCCSYGLWQYNICGGLGNSYLVNSGYSESSKESKLDLLHDYGSQVEFMVDHLKKTYGSEIIKEKTAEEWVDWFVTKIERPANPEQAIEKRRGYLNKLDKKGVFNYRIYQLFYKN